MDTGSAEIKRLQQKIALYEDMKAYEQLYELLYDGLHRFSNAFVKSNEAAEEIVSDVFIKLWQIRDKLTGIDNLKVYLYTIARNFSYNYLTRHYKKVVLSLDETDPEVLIALDDPEALCISADLVSKIREAIHQLPPQCRIIFQLVREEGMKYKEVAEVLHLSTLTVRNQVAIATRKIAALLPPTLAPAPTAAPSTPGRATRPGPETPISPSTPG
jgi:RNA polymerase sigma-70 factor (family 1)